ncbi:hypothetical protein H261_12744, partial [Paramagnetospirillum caucaseum]
SIVTGRIVQRGRSSNWRFDIIESPNLLHGGRRIGATRRGRSLNPTGRRREAIGRRRHIRSASRRRRFDEISGIHGRLFLRHISRPANDLIQVLVRNFRPHWLARHFASPKTRVFPVSCLFL